MELRRLAAENKSDEFFAVLFHLLQEQLGERLDVPASAITEAVIEEQLRPKRAPEPVLASLQETYPGIDWEKQGAYYFQRVIEHGRRRAEEVREVADTVREAGLTPWSAKGTADRQAWVADLADDGLFGPKGTKEFARSADWRTEADRILANRKRGE